MKQLFPKEIIENTVEVHQFEHSNKSKIIYSTILFAFIIVLVLLPFIKVDIYTTARGMLKPSKERIAITPLQSGKVVYANMVDNQKVKKGDTLMMTNTTVVKDNIKRATTQIVETKKFISDCEYLINTSKPNFSNIQSARYQKEFLYFTQKIQELQTRFEKTKVDELRNEKLYKKGVVAKVDYENSAFEHQLAASTLQQYRKQQRNNWQATLTEYQNVIRDLESNVSQLQQNQKELVITAPINGVLKNVLGIEPGSLIPGGVKLAEISPDTGLIAECYIYPSDIGLISKDKAVNFQIDAFNYNQWGLATGEILEISKDVDIINEQPVFKVRCAVDQKHLELKNGFKGNFNKGMTLSARFQLTERTLFELLYDKVDDWLNPSSPTIASIQN
ncbi:HlyD family efflux transporter periplasmic adaptor subunit [Aquimarina sp. AD10]|uniref:HlyD family secretion protein n=1 Tax=Aquimarina sp. AD10 TaxID=1714849 RepID=UPI000E4D070F|nr:HlyD family efflux transporter periplasmic adaptor subunit [Aquimarina sp. AD10]AXT62171.1 HlyD family efflux transporter periplasmic adaptor subunit [Aquimarina sp. AD10]RKM90634.1 HlyD family efflux transporter periplasmic adaptor subunit [Aquimarina sp. AD10]